VTYIYSNQNSRKAWGLNQPFVQMSSQFKP